MGQNNGRSARVHFSFRISIQISYTAGLYTGDSVQPILQLCSVINRLFKHCSVAFIAIPFVYLLSSDANKICFHYTISCNN